MSRFITVVGITLLGLAGWLGASNAAEVPDRGDAAAIEQALALEPASKVEDSTAPGSPVEPDQLSELSDASTEEARFELPQFTIGQSRSIELPPPVAIRIPTIEATAPVISVGVEDNGEMTVPENVNDVAWYQYGPSPGEPGSAVLAAHVDLAGQGPGVFFNLRELEPGDLIEVELADGTVSWYEATARKTYDKDDLPTDIIFSRSGPPVLTLITCGGDFNRSIRSYDSNVVVYAVPTEAPDGNPA